MALIPCPDCGRDVSDSAPTCPQCGRPIAQTAMPVAAVDEPLVTTQATGKSLKAHILLAWIIVFIGFAGFAQAAKEDQDVFGWVLLVGLVWLIVAKVSRWWQHG